MYTVTKHFEFCYAHRLHDYPGKCGKIHGHTARVEVSCNVNDLPENGMAIDFNELKTKIGAWIDETLDHRLILFSGDPMVATLTKAGEDVFELHSPPSAEHLAKLIFESAKELGFPVTNVSFWESPKSTATYNTLRV